MRDRGFESPSARSPRPHQSEFWRDPSLPYLVDARSTHLAVDPFHLHTHDSWLVSLVEAGGTRARLRDTVHEIRAGVVVVVPPGEPHACNPSPGDILQYKSLFLHAGWLHCLHAGAGPALLEGPAAEAVRRALTAAYHIFRGPGERLEKDEAFQDLLAALGRVWPAGPVSASSTTEAAGDSRHPFRLVRVVQECLLSHLGRVVTLEELATAAGTSPHQLLRTFRRQVGLSPHAWQMQRRIEQAKTFLAAGLPPAEVALETGFSDQSHFHRVFKRYVGATPGQYQAGVPTGVPTGVPAGVPANMSAGMSAGASGNPCKIVQSLPPRPLA
ncbi:helix-turn-helix domain-containing protein [Megalodesulfovibrio paquesii]